MNTPTKVVVINGPNLNLLGTREPSIYGYDTLDDIAAKCSKLGADRNLEVTFKQSNYEGQIVDWIQEAINSMDVLVINAGAYTHTSIAIHDALRAFSGKKIELHISNPHLREVFRHTSYISPVVDGVVAGLGVGAYEEVIEMISEFI